MKLLLDHCISNTVATILQSQHKVMNFLPAAKDEDVFIHAKKIDAVLITNDRDFTKSKFTFKKHPSVIILSANVIFQPDLIHNLLLRYRDKSHFYEKLIIVKKTKIITIQRKGKPSEIALKNLQLIKKVKGGRSFY